MIIISIFAFVGLFSSIRLQSLSLAYGHSTTSLDSIFLAFAGPTVEMNSILDGLVWLVPQLFLFFLVGNLASLELKASGEYILPLLGSRYLWWAGKLIMLFIIVSGFFLSGFLIVFMISKQMTTSDGGWGELILLDNIYASLVKYKPSYIGFIILVLLISTGLIMAILQTLLSLVFDSIRAYFIVAFISVSTCLGGNSFKQIITIMPSNQSILSRHSLFLNNPHWFSINWSLIYNIVFLTLLITFGFIYIKKMDIIPEKGIDC